MNNNFFKILKDRLVFIISLIIFFTSLPFFIVYSFLKPINDKYEVKFSYENNIENYTSLISLDSLNYVKQNLIDTRNKMIEEGKTPTYSDFSYVKTKELVSKERIEIKEESSYYVISVSVKYFNSKAQAKRFIKGLVENKNIIDDLKYTYLSENIIELNESLDTYLLLSICVLSAILVTFVLIFILYKLNPKIFGDSFEYDNKTIFRTIFHKEYFKESLKPFKDLKSLVFIAILFALMLVTKLIKIPSGFSNLGIGFGYLIFGIICLLYGPFVGIIIGAMSDILGFVIAPSGIFFFGYTLTSMLAGLTYGLCFFKTKITFTKCLFARLVVNILLNSVLGSLWYTIMYDTYTFKAYFLLVELPKNIAYLIPQSLLLFIVFKALVKPMEASGLIDSKISSSVSIF